ncbi:MAG: low affinity iron permease family protein [Acidobacteria bacterium]|nr:MAG: low affinity iron permease family protein [Acidobacteriota bacterium]
MEPRNPHPTSGAERLAMAASRFTARGAAFTIAASVVAVWVLSGPVFRYSNTWQLVINTGTTIVTFLMVFLIQRSQSKDALAMQLKLNEIVAALQGASNRLVSVENLSEKELAALHAHYEKLSEMAKRDMDLLKSHSIEEAQARHRTKLRPGGPHSSKGSEQAQEEHRSEEPDQPAGR